MRRIALLVVAIVVILVLASCGGEDLIANCGPQGVKFFHEDEGVGYTVCNNGKVFR